MRTILCGVLLFAFAVEAAPFRPARLKSLKTQACATLARELVELPVVSALPLEAVLKDAAATRAALSASDAKAVGKALGLPADAAAEQVHQELTERLKRVPCALSLSADAFKTCVQARLQAIPQEVQSRQCKERLAAVPEGVGAAGAPLVGGAGWEAAVLEGLSNFLADRAEQEVVAWFFETFSRELCTTAGDLFPQTCAMVGPLDDGKGASAPLASNPGALFTAALRSDLEKLPARAVFLALGGSCGGDKPCKDQRDVLATGLVKAFGSLRLGALPLEVLGAFGQGPLQDAAVARCAAASGKPAGECVLGVAGVLALYSGDIVQQVATLRTEEQVVAFVLKLVNDPALRAALASYQLFPKNDTDDPARVEQIKGALQAMVDTVVRLTDTLEAWRRQPGTGASDSLLRAGTMLGLMTDFWGAAAQLARLDEKKIETATNLLGAVASAFKGDFAASVKDLLLADTGNVVFDEKTRRLLGVLSELAAAKDAKTVQSLLEAQAAPAGSWRLKRSGFTVSLVGLVGGGGGGEWALGAPSKPGGWSAGLMAQVGLDLVGPVGPHGWSLGCFFSVLDVGQLSWTRIDASVRGVEGPQASPDLGFAQVFSPGAFLLVGLGRSPFVLSAGVSLAPQLRRYVVTDSADRTVSALRFTLGFSVDVTILPIYHAVK